MSPKKGPFQKDISSSNHRFSGEKTLVFGEVRLPPERVAQPVREPTSFDDEASGAPALSSAPETGGNSRFQAKATVLEGKADT